jgi:hypothetical protein
MDRIGNLAFLPSVATFATTLLNNVQNLSKREYWTIVFCSFTFIVTLWAALLTQNYQFNELAMQHDHNFKYLQGQYNERFELRELQRSFEVDIRLVIEKDPGQFWYDVKPIVEKYGTYIALSNFVDVTGLDRGGPRDVFDNVYREIDEPKQSRQRLNAIKHATYQDKFRNHLHDLFNEEQYEWSDARKLFHEHKCYITLNEYVIIERLNHGRPRDIYKEVVEDFKEKTDYYDKEPKEDNTCNPSNATDDLYQLSNSKVFQSRIVETKENITFRETNMESLRGTSGYASVLERSYYSSVLKMNNLLISMLITELI